MSNRYCGLMITRGSGEMEGKHLCVLEGGGGEEKGGSVNVTAVPLIFD